MTIGSSDMTKNDETYSFDVSVRIQKLINQVKDIISGIAELSYSEVS